MKSAHTPSENIGDLIDRIEHIRNELHAIQKQMEKMEPAESIAIHDPSKKTNG